MHPIANQLADYRFQYPGIDLLDQACELYCNTLQYLQK